MALMDLLNSFLSPQGSNGPAFGQTAGAISPGQSAAPGGQASTPMSELLVQANSRPKSAARGPATTMPSDSTTMAPPVDYNPVPPDPGTPQTAQPPSLNYDNSGSVGAVHQSLMSNPPQPGGMTNPGVYGLLPPSMQHGTLRSVLGAISDAMLVQGGNKPAYANEQARQQVGNAMAGMDINDPQSVQAAVQRIAATGAPGATDMADKLQQQAEQAALRKQYMEYNNNYREQMVGVRQDQLHANQANIADRYRPQIGGMLSGVHDAATYATKYASLAPLAQQIGGPDATPASLWSIPEPAAWTPELMGNYGMTANNVQQSSDRAQQRATSTVNAHINAGSRVQSAGISGGAHIAAANISANKPDEATFQDSYIRAKQAGATTTPEQDARYAHDTQVSSRSRRPPPSSAGGGPPVMTPQQAARLPKGTPFRTTDGRILHRQ